MRLGSVMENVEEMLFFVKKFCIMKCDQNNQKVKKLMKDIAGDEIFKWSEPVVWLDV